MKIGYDGTLKPAANPAMVSAGGTHVNSRIVRDIANATPETQKLVSGFYEIGKAIAETGKQIRDADYAVDSQRLRQQYAGAMEMVRQELSTRNFKDFDEYRAAFSAKEQAARESVIQSATGENGYFRNYNSVWKTRVGQDLDFLRGNAELNAMKTWNQLQIKNHYDGIDQLYKDAISIGASGGGIELLKTAVESDNRINEKDKPTFVARNLVIMNASDARKRAESFMRKTYNPQIRSEWMQRLTTERNGEENLKLWYDWSDGEIDREWSEIKEQAEKLKEEYTKQIPDENQRKAIESLIDGERDKLNKDFYENAKIGLRQEYGSMLSESRALDSREVSDYKNTGVAPTRARARAYLAWEQAKEAAKARAEANKEAAKLKEKQKQEAAKLALEQAKESAKLEEKKAKATEAITNESLEIAILKAKDDGDDALALSLETELEVRKKAASLEKEGVPKDVARELAEERIRIEGVNIKDKNAGKSSGAGKKDKSLLELAQDVVAGNIQDTTDENIVRFIDAYNLGSDSKYGYLLDDVDGRLTAITFPDGSVFSQSEFASKQAFMNASQDKLYTQLLWDVSGIDFKKQDNVSALNQCSKILSVADGLLDKERADNVRTLVDAKIRGIGADNTPKEVYDVIVSGLKNDVAKTFGYNKYSDFEKENQEVAEIVAGVAYRIGNCSSGEQARLIADNFKATELGGLKEEATRNRTVVQLTNAIAGWAITQEANDYVMRLDKVGLEGREPDDNSEQDNKQKERVYEYGVRESDIDKAMEKYEARVSLVGDKAELRALEDGNSVNSAKVFREKAERDEWKRIADEKLNNGFSFLFRGKNENLGKKSSSEPSLHVGDFDNAERDVSALRAFEKHRLINSAKKEHEKKESDRYVNIATLKDKYGNYKNVKIEVPKTAPKSEYDVSTLIDGYREAVDVAGGLAELDAHKARKDPGRARKNAESDKWREIFISVVNGNGKTEDAIHRLDKNIELVSSRNVKPTGGVYTEREVLKILKIWANNEKILGEVRARTTFNRKKQLKD